MTNEVVLAESRTSKKSRPPKIIARSNPPSNLPPPSIHPTSIQPTLSTMPLDTSTYSLALLRLDGRRWNELRRLTAQISTQPAADGSSYLEMGNTKVICTVTGPLEAKSTGGNRSGGDRADVQVSISIAGFSGVDRKRRGRGDK
jgi:hypothetical protein